MPQLSEYDKAQEAAAYIKSQVQPQQLPSVAVICGSGLGKYSESLEPGATRIDYQNIPNIHAASVQGHAGCIYFGRIGSSKTSIMIISGRLHSYEGLDITETVLLVRVCKLLNINTLIVTNAAGAVNESYRVGDLVLINDHLNLPGMSGLNPLRGPNDERFGPRFPAMNDAYTHKLRATFLGVVDEAPLKRSIHEGVYAYFSGPNYETQAEVRMCRSLGADVVGMSTVPEVLAAVHCGLDVLALSLVTNECIGHSTPSGRTTAHKVNPPNHKEVMEASEAAAQDLQLLLTTFIDRRFGSAEANS